MKGDQLVAIIVVLVVTVSTVLIWWRRWTGRDRAWYERPLPFGGFMNDVLGPSPLARIILAAGIAGVVGGLLIGQLQELAGFAIIAIGGLAGGVAALIMILRPGWAKPSWMEEVDQAHRNMRHR